MSLSPGTTLGSFEISGLLGVGGMGEVYRARDTKLGREVAVKVLPEAFAQDPERLARFEREAKLLAALNHSNIAGIHEIGHQQTEGGGTTHFLVMELVEGIAFDEKLSRGPMSIEDALPLFAQIAEALENAHEHGIIHRDLKPANIKITEDGRVKLLDFGLAKALEGGGAGSDSAPTKRDTAGLDSTAETLLTQGGRILGTPAYMAPEQARGEKVDKRVDIWAFGCCLYEALTGKRPFEGGSASELIAEILKSEPDWEALPAGVPGRIRDLIVRCLQKDPRQRLRDIGDARIELDQSGSDISGALPASGTTIDANAVGKARLYATAIGALILGGLIAAAGLSYLRSQTPPEALVSPGSPALAEAMPRPVRRYSISLPGDYPVASQITVTDITLAVSPDGSMLIYVANVNGIRQLIKKELNSFEANPIAGTEGAVQPFFSPDGEWIGYLDPAQRKLKKISIHGGAPTVICDASLPLGAAWGRDGKIIFASNLGIGLLRVSDQGGEPETLTTLDRENGEVFHVTPSFMPDQRELLYVVSSQADIEHSRVALLNLETGERRFLAEKAGRPLYLASGHLLYVQQGSIIVRPFDAGTLEFTGPAMPIHESRIVTRETVPTQFALTRDGTLVFVPVHSGSNTIRRVIWVDREGNETPTQVPAGPYDVVTIAPDETQVALGEPFIQDIWIFELDRAAAPRRVTFDSAPDAYPYWTSDGTYIVFSSQRDGNWNLMRKRADGTGAAERLLESSQLTLPWSTPASGDLLLYTRLGESGNYDVGVLTMSEPSDAKIILGEEFNETSPALSSDGHWIAYTSDESGRDEVYVRPFPSLESKWQVSTRGGKLPLWRGDGKELFYLLENQVLAVEIETEPGFRSANPEVLFEGPYEGFTGVSHAYNVSSDGQRFLMIKDPGAEVGDAARTPFTELSIVENWFTELQRIAPTKPAD